MILPPPSSPYVGLTGAISTRVRNVFLTAFSLSCTTYLSLLFVVKRGERMIGASLRKGESESKI